MLCTHGWPQHSEPDHHLITSDSFWRPNNEPASTNPTPGQCHPLGSRNTDRQTQTQAGAAHPCRVSSYTPAAPAAAAARAGHELGWFGVKMHPGGCPGKQGCVLQFFTSHHPPAAVLEGESCLPTPSAAEQCRTAGSCREPACLACRRECGAKPCLVPRSSRPGAANCCWKEPGAR